MVKLGIIGLGRWGRILLENLNPMSEIVYACSTGGSQGRHWLNTRYPHVRWTPHYDRVVDDTEIDGVVIATPPGTHADLALRAIQARKHVLVEKPMAQDSSMAWKVRARARESNCLLLVGHTFCYDEPFRVLCDTVTRDPAVNARFEWQKYGTFEESLLWNLLPHDVALALELFNCDPSGMSVVRGKPSTAWCDSCHVELDFGSERHATITVDRMSGYRRKRVSVTTESGAMYRLESGKLLRYSERREECVSYARRSSLARELSYFVRGVEMGAGARCEDGSLGLKVVEVLVQLAADGR